MTWTKPSLAFFMLLLLQGCGIYSFSGTSLPSEVKTFSLQYQSRVALGPPDLLERFTEKLSNELLQRTPLKQVPTQGDIQFEGEITQFKYTPVAPSARGGSSKEDHANITRLTIEVQMNYINPYSPEFAFSKRKFSQHADTPAESSTEQAEPGLIDEIFTKLVKDIFNASVAGW